MRQRHKVMTAQALPVGVCNLSALGVEGFKMCQLDAQAGGLDFVQAAVVAHHFVIVAIHAPPMVAQHEDGIGQSIIAGGNQPAVAAGAKILAGKKAESAGQAHAAGLAPVNGGAETLGAVLDQNQVMIVGNALQGVRSEENTSELQSRGQLVCGLVHEKKKPSNKRTTKKNTQTA